MVDGDSSRILDVDLDVVALGDDVIDDFSAGADDVTDLIWVNVEGDHLWSVFADLGSWLSDSAFHDFADLSAGFVGLGKSFAKDLTGDAVDLDVHLKGGDAFFGAGALEVHITEVVFKTLDIGEDGVMVGLFVWGTAWVSGD